MMVPARRAALTALVSIGCMCIFHCCPSSTSDVSVVKLKRKTT